MARESLINLIKAVSTDASLRQEFLATDTLEEKATVAVRHGYDITPAELEALRTMSGEGTSGDELSDTELNLVAGGSLAEIWSGIKKTAHDVVGALTGPRYKHIANPKYND